MTCIVGMIRNDNVYMGGDSASSCTTSVDQIKDISSKVFVKEVGKRFNFIYGFTSSFRMGQILRYSFVEPQIEELPTKKELVDSANLELEYYLVNHYITELREVFKNTGYANVSNNEETGGFFLLGITDKKKILKPRLFTIQNDFSLIESIGEYDATGSGEDYAIGAMTVLIKNKKISPVNILEQALDAAALKNPFVTPPFVIGKI